MGFIYDIYSPGSGDINGRISGSPLEPGIQCTPLFLPSSRIDLLKGPHLIDPGDPGDLFGCLWYKQSDTWWSMHSPRPDETSRNAKVQELSVFGVALAVQYWREDVARRPRTWKSRLFYCYRFRSIDIISCEPSFEYIHMLVFLIYSRWGIFQGNKDDLGNERSGVLEDISHTSWPRKFRQAIIRYSLYIHSGGINF